jgi:hypothetical protein
MIDVGQRDGLENVVPRWYLRKKIALQFSAKSLKVMVPVTRFELVTY